MHRPYDLTDDLDVLNGRRVSNEGKTATVKGHFAAQGFAFFLLDDGSTRFPVGANAAYFDWGLGAKR